MPAKELDDALRELAAAIERGDRREARDALDRLARALPLLPLDDARCDHCGAEAEPAAEATARYAELVAVSRAAVATARRRAG